MTNLPLFDITHPLWQALVAASLFLLLLLLLLLLSWRSTRRSEKLITPFSAHLQGLQERVQQLSDGQQQLSGGLLHVSEAHGRAQAQMVQTMEQRLEEVQRAMGESLHGTAQRTARSLGELQERLNMIDQAQTKIEALSGNVLSLQDILSNKQARGAFGEIQLQDIVSKALPPTAYSFQHTLSNGKRADCVVHMPDPPGLIAIDSKFPLEGYEAMRAAQNDGEFQAAQRQFRDAVRKHFNDIAERYIVEGETADSALMFVPSEAVYAELHANFPALVREGFEKRVWLVSPTTCMATLNTMRAVLKDAELKKQASRIRSELSALYKDVERLGTRVGNLDRHFQQAQKDVEEIKISAQKTSSRARRLEDVDFEEEAPRPLPNVVSSLEKK